MRPFAVGDSAKLSANCDLRIRNDNTLMKGRCFKSTPPGISKVACGAADLLDRYLRDDEFFAVEYDRDLAFACRQLLKSKAAELVSACL